MPYFKTENSNAENIKYDNTKSVKEAIDEIKASSSSNPTAASVTFDNTDTGLEATNVQDAVTEVNGKLNSSLIKYKSIEVEATTTEYSGSLGGYTGYYDIKSLLPSGTIIGMTVNKCQQKSDASRVGVVSNNNGSYEAIRVNAQIADTFVVNLTILYI